MGVGPRLTAGAMAGGSAEGAALRRFRMTSTFEISMSDGTMQSQLDSLRSQTKWGPNGYGEDLGRSSRAGSRLHGL
eukprot:4352709-Pyramimonas_sp.AAC.1